MANNPAAVENNIYDIFQVELCTRVSILPIKSTGGNYCISINMRSCSDTFIMAADEFLQKESNCYNLLVTGEDYYIEVLNCNSLTNAKKYYHNDGIIDSVAEKAGLSKTDASKALAATLESITEGLKAGEKVPLRGFGAFSVSQRTARNGKNAQTGKTLSIAASKTARFKASKHLKGAVN